MRWSTYILLAEAIAPAVRKAAPPKPLATDDDFARARSVISRAYYAAFHVAQEYVLTTGMWVPERPTQHLDHGQLWGILQGTRAKPSTADQLDAGNRGSSLMEARRKADYKLWDAKGLHYWVDNAASEAREICRLLKHTV